MRLKVLVVDDEPLARDGLKLLLSRQSGVESVSEARNGREAIAIIRERPPDLVLLDVQMPRMNGFAVVQAIGPERMPAVIFVTAHDQYAIRAFEFAALDYLLKPVTEERFALAFGRASARVRMQPQDETARQVVAMLDAIASPPRRLTRFAVRSGERTIFVPVDDAPAARPHEHHGERARSRALPAHSPVAHRERPPHRAAVVARARPVHHRAAIRAAPAFRADLRRQDSPRAVEPVLTKTAAAWRGTGRAGGGASAAHTAGAGRCKLSSLRA
jgi:DNA-binding LytR/AlgR family response regulator